MTLFDPEFAVTIVSPCVGRCAVDEDRVCRGCHRTLGEIAAWTGASEECKAAIVAAAARRAERDNAATKQPICDDVI